MSTASDIRAALEAAGTVAAASAAALPPPSNIVAGIVAAALESASALIDQGQTPEQIVAAIHRARRLDTSASDAAVDALVAAKPAAQVTSSALVNAAQVVRGAIGGAVLVTDPAVMDAVRALVDHHDPQAPA